MSDFAWMCLVFIVIVVVCNLPDIISAWRGDKDK